MDERWALPRNHAVTAPWRWACRPLLSLLREQNIEAIDKMLAPFFRDAPAALWPQLVMIEDARQQWAVDLFALMAKKIIA